MHQTVPEDARVGNGNIINPVIATATTCNLAKESNDR